MSVNITVNPTKAMIEKGAQRLVSWEDGCVWPDSWDAFVVSAARNSAKRVWRSMYIEAEAGSLPSESQARSNLASAIMFADLIRRSLIKAHRLVPADDDNSQLIDLINHMDTLAQQIEALAAATDEEEK